MQPNRFLSKDEQNVLPARVLFGLCKGVDTPVSLGVWLRFKYGEFLAMAEMKLDPLAYENHDSFDMDFTVVSLFQKWKGLKTGIDTEAVALRSFAASEAHCLETNKRLRKSAYSGFSPETERDLFAIQRKIANLLGPFSNFKIEPFFGWGPGATFEFSRRRALLDDKISSNPMACSRLALPLLRSVISSDLHWSSVIPDSPSNFITEDRCRITTVPKNAKTARVIAIEPNGNIFLQKGFGGYFRSRLKTVGVDLDDQSCNKGLAKQAFDFNLSTIDLRSASDTVSREVVYLLLPPEWAEALDSVRSKKALMPDSTERTLEKFSSMGNGFTFELESLIFWAITKVVSERIGTGEIVSIYGDDIICHQDAASAVVERLEEFGFIVNRDKSFFNGPFYESCGGQYFHGFDVTPTYQKDELKETIDGIRFANRLIERASRDNYLDRRFLSAWSAALDPDSPFQAPLGSRRDGAYAVPWFLFKYKRSYDRSHGYFVRYLKESEVSFPAKEEALLAWSLRKLFFSLEGTDFAGQLTRVTGTYLVGKCRVIPDGKFGLDWR